jgi:S1-C subfamily serine protease
VLARATKGQTLQVELMRESKPQTARLVAEQIPPGAVDELAGRLLGLELEPNPRGGFAVKKVRTGSGSEKIGLAAGDVILRINGRPLEDADALRRSILDLRGRERAILVVQRGPGRYHVAIPLT